MVQLEETAGQRQHWCIDLPRGKLRLDSAHSSMHQCWQQLLQLFLLTIFGDVSNKAGKVTNKHDRCGTGDNGLYTTLWSLRLSGDPLMEWGYHEAQ